MRRPKTTPIHELERYMRCRDCSDVRGLSLQAQPSHRLAAEQDFSERSAVNVVAGIAVPYFASFAYTLETNQFVIAVLEGKIRSGSIEFARGVNVVSALILAFGLAFLFRTIANAAIRDIKD